MIIAEAFMVRHHPQWQRAREIIRAGDIGELRSIQVIFTYFNVEPDNIRNRADIGGGGLLDIGCYAVVAGRSFFDAEPIRTIALVDHDPTYHVDRTTSAILDFDKGRQLTFTVSTQSVPFQRVQLLGTRGRIEIEIPFTAPPDRPTRIFVDNGSTHGGVSAKAIELPVTDQYEQRGLAFSRAVREAASLDAIRRSAETDAWELILPR